MLICPGGLDPFNDVVAKGTLAPGELALGFLELLDFTDDFEIGLVGVTSLAATDFVL